MNKFKRNRSLRDKIRRLFHSQARPIDNRPTVKPLGISHTLFHGKDRVGLISYVEPVMPKDKKTRKDLEKSFSAPMVKFKTLTLAVME